MVVYARTYGQRKLNVKNLNECLAQIEKVGKVWAPQQLRKWLDAWGLKIQADIHSTLRRGYGRASGRLAHSYTHEVEVTKSGVEMRVGTNVPYAKFVEGVPRVPRRHYLPFQGHPAFADWARRIIGLRRSQIDLSYPTLRAGFKSRKAKKSYLYTAPIRWQDRKKIRGFMVGGPKSVRPALIPAINRMTPRMAADTGRILDQ